MKKLNCQIKLIHALIISAIISGCNSDSSNQQTSTQPKQAISQVVELPSVVNAIEPEYINITAESGVYINCDADNGVVICEDPIRGIGRSKFTHNPSSTVADILNDLSVASDQKSRLCFEFDGYAFNVFAHSGVHTFGYQSSNCLGSGEDVNIDMDYIVSQYGELTPETISVDIKSSGEWEAKL